MRGRIVFQRGDRGEHRVVGTRPSSAVLRVPLKRRPRIVHSSRRPIRLRESIVGGAPFGKQRQRAFEMWNRRQMMILGGINAAEAEFGTRLGEWLPGQRFEQSSASNEIASLDERLGKRQTGWQIGGRFGQGAFKSLGRLAVAREPFEHDAVEIQPFETVGRQRLRALVGLMRGIELLPGLQHTGKRADGLGIGRAGGRSALKRGDRFPGGRRVPKAGQVSAAGAGHFAARPRPSPRGRRL